MYLLSTLQSLLRRKHKAPDLDLDSSKALWFIFKQNALHTASINNYNVIKCHWSQLPQMYIGDIRTGWKDSTECFFY